jgi:hypothetical protein
MFLYSVNFIMFFRELFIRCCWVYAVLSVTRVGRYYRVTIPREVRKLLRVLLINYLKIIH